MDLSFIKFQLKFRKVFAITIAWQIVAIFNTLYMFAYVSSVVDVEVPYNLPRSLLYSFIIASLGGFLFGALEVFYMKRLLRKKTFGFVLIIKIVLYVILLFLVYLLATMLYFKNEYNISIFSPQVVSDAVAFVMRPFMLLELAFWGMIIMLTFFYLEIAERLGPGGLAGFILGRYHKPRKETRIFMFLDIKGSTQIAEMLGHKRYFNFLNDFFSDITDSVIFSRGEIYQYVGDEVLVSWTLKNGLKNAQCLKCFFDIKHRISKRQEDYMVNYGFAPEFKAGFNHGEVMAGEIGLVKRDLVFSGDVLNTGARIQEKCNVYGVDNLISRGLIKFISLPDEMTCERVDAITLRGKKSKIELYTVKQNNRIS